MTPEEELARLRTRSALFVLEDRILIGITDGKCDHESIRQLPPWRAVLLARVAYKAGVMRRADLDELVREARVYGELKPWSEARR